MARAGKPDPRKRLFRFVEQLVWPPGQAERCGLVYDGPAAFVLEHGEWFEPRPLPAGIERGLAGHCYQTAIHNAIVHGLDYVEGYALEPDLEHVFAHAWNADADGGLVDATWTGEAALFVRDGRPTVYVGKPGAAYLGVRFSAERADDCTWNGDAHVLDDYIRRWPLLRSRWEGEPEGIEWPPSPRLDSMRAFAAGDIELARRLYQTYAAEVEVAEREAARGEA